MSDLLNHVFLSYLDHIKFEKRYSQHTFRAYSDDLTFFLSFIRDQFAVDAPEQVTSAMIRSWMASLSLDKIQPRSINRKISSVKSFFRHCLLQGVIKTSPTKQLQVLKTRKRLPSYVEQDQMQRLLKEVEFSDDLKGETEYLIVSLLYHTGMRVSELVGLRCKQVDVHRSQLKVLGKGNKERIIPLDPGMIERINKYLIRRAEWGSTDGQAYVLLNAGGKPLSPRTVYGIVRNRLSLVTTADKKSPHVLRHSFATHLTGNGAELNAVKELLGHTSLAATQVYTHNSIERLREIHRKAHPKG